MLTEQTQSLVLTRVLKASQEKVYNAWIDPIFVAKWFKPNERWTKCEADVNPIPGGNYIVKMTHQDGDVITIDGRVVEVLPTEKVVFTWRDNSGGELGLESLVTVDLKTVADGTELTLTHSKITSADALESFNGGWTGCLATLTSFIEA
jgi:uncharacterized protein YndB with AHSA1/START domain